MAERNKFFPSEIKPAFAGLVKFTEKFPPLARLFRTQDKGPLLVYYPRPMDRILEQHNFTVSLIEKIRGGEAGSIRDREREIAEWFFRRHIVIPGTGIAVRPFWRDGKSAPRLPWVDRFRSEVNIFLTAVIFLFMI